MSARAALPTGTVTFLFTDIEGSTRLLQRLGDQYQRLLADHRRLIGDAANAHGGVVFGTEGDALFIAFGDAASALAAAADAQRALAAHDWPDDVTVRVRMGIHTGQVTVLGDDYVGLALHQVARIAAAANGGQVLVSMATHELAGPSLPEGYRLRDLGEHRLKDLTLPERLFQLVAPGLAQDFGRPHTLDVRPNNLPVQLTSFVGREELAAARDLLDRTHLLTLTGPGGTGKTRLALQLAAEVSESFSDGVFFVPLDTIRQPDLVPPAIVAGLGLSEATNEPLLQRAIGHLRDRHVLLVLDNFEQVLDAAPLVGELLRGAPDVRVVVTSRIPLRIHGEQELPVPPLAMPDAAAGATADAAGRWEAVRLFVERAMAVQPSFRLTDAAAPAVVDIVRRLDGLPLAIELAAARIRVLSPEAIRARLDRRLGLLTGGPRDLPARQQTLRAAIDWSHDLLDEPDRKLFARFAVFAGGATLSEAEAVCGPAHELGRDLLEGLGSLSDKSLVRSVLTRDEEPRFAMLATIRDYALERLAASSEEAELRRRHAQAFVALVERSAGHLTGREAKRWLDRLEDDHDNLRAALDWACEHHEAGVALRIVAAIWRFWQVRGHLHEAKWRIERALDTPGVTEQPSLLLAGAYRAAGSVAYWRADWVAAHRYYTAGLAHARSAGDPGMLAGALYDAGFAPSPDPLTVESRYREGRPYFQEARALYEELGDPAGVADADWALAISAVGAGDLEAARRHVTESLERRRALRDPFGIGWATHLLGLVELRTGDVRQAEARFREVLSIFATSGDQGGILIGLGNFALLAEKHGARQRYWRLAGAVESLRITSGTDLVLAAIGSLEYVMPPAPTDPDDRRSWDEGRAMSTEQAVAYALAGGESSVRSTADVLAVDAGPPR